MQSVSTLPVGVTLDADGFFVFDRTKYSVYNKFDPLVKRFAILSATDYLDPNSLQWFQVYVNCETAAWMNRLPTRLVAGHTVAAAKNPDGSGFHLTGQWPGEFQDNLSDVFTINPDIAPDIQSFLNWDAGLSNYVGPQNVNPGTFTQVINTANAVRRNARNAGQKSA